MHWASKINRQLPILLLVGFMFMACEMVVPEEEFDNPLDLTTNQELGIDPPALVFVPNQISTSTGSTVTFEVFVLEVDSAAGSQLQIHYDKSKLSLSSVTSGDFFTGSTEPLFFYEHDAITGTIDIYTLFMGDAKAVSGTGTLAYLVFSSTAPGQSIVTYSNESELVDRDDNPILLNGLGQGVVDAQ